MNTIENIEKTMEILQNMDFNEKSLRCLASLIEGLESVAKKYDPSTTNRLFDDFFNYETLNYVRDEELSKINLEKWSKNSIIEWTEKHDLENSVEGIFNENALVVAMNNEYKAHKDYIDKTGDAPMTSYLLAKGALYKEDYIKKI